MLNLLQQTVAGKQDKGKDKMPFALESVESQIYFVSGRVNCLTSFNKL